MTESAGRGRPTCPLSSGKFVLNFQLKRTSPGRGVRVKGSHGGPFRFNALLDGNKTTLPSDMESDQSKAYRHSLQGLFVYKVCKGAVPTDKIARLGHDLASMRL
jgi:hypothetical protein